MMRTSIGEQNKGTLGIPKAMWIGMRRMFATFNVFNGHGGII
jgi:hypothetical protein